MATAPQAAPAAANPYNDPNTLAVYDQLRKTVSPKEFGDEMLAGASQVDPQEVANFRSTLQQIQLPPEALDLLNNMVDEILANPEKYAEIRAKYKEMGAPDEILPEQFDAHFFAALNMAIDQMIAAPSGEQAFAKGGIAELKPVSKAIAGYGRNGDTMLAHITPAEARMLRRKGGSGTINPKTGLPEFFNLFKEIGNAFKAVGKAVKSFVNSTVGRMVTTVALGFFLGPAAASFIGATSTAAVAAVSGFVGSAGSTLLGGGNLSQALKAGAVGGLTAGAGAGIMGGASAFEAGSYTGPTTIGGQFDKFTGAISPAQAAPTDVLRDNVTTSTARDAYISDLNKTNPELFKTPTAGPVDASAAEQFAAKKITLGGGLPEQVTLPNGAVVTQNAANPFAPTATNYGAFGEAPINASAATAASGNAVAPAINTQPVAMPTATTGNALAPAIANPMDATQFQGSLAKMPVGGTEPSFFDNVKDFYNKNISPSNIQQQGMGAAQEAGAKAVTDLAARIPDATPAMREAAFQNAYKAAMPGMLATYGPATALGIGAIGAFGGFSPKAAPVSPFQDMLTGGPGSARDLLSKNPGRYYVQGLPGVNYYNGSVIKPTGMAKGGIVMPRHFELGGAADGTWGIQQDGGFGGGYDFGDYDLSGGGYDAGGFNGGWSDTAYPGGIPGYDDYVIGSDNSNLTNNNTSTDAPYDPYADEGPSQSNPNVVGGGTTGTDDQGEMTITGKRMYNVGDESVFDPTYGGTLAPVIGGGNESVFDPTFGGTLAPVIGGGGESVFNPGTTINAGDEHVFDPTFGGTLPLPDDDIPTVTITDKRPGGTEHVFDPTFGGTLPITTSCPAPEMRILLANGALKAAGELQVGDVVKTQHENTLAWGEHPVTHVSLVPDASRIKFTFDDGEFVCSLDHKFFKAANEWVTAKDVIPGDMLSGKTVRSIEQASTGDVVRITIDDAHTYISEGLLSHNKSPVGPTVVDPIVVEPPVIQPPVVPPEPPVKPTCPAPEMRILLADGNLKAAGDLQVGDVLRTQHETTLAWGDHPVTHVSIVPDVPRLKIELGDVEFVCSLDHKFFKSANEWVTAKDIAVGDMLSGHVVRSLTQADVGDVVRITVDDAHTYICEGLLSHNKSPLPPDLPPVVITPPYVPPVVVEPPYVPPTVPPVVVRNPGTASIDPRVAGVPGGSYMFTRNTPNFPTGVLSRTMSPYTGGITGLMPNIGVPPQALAAVEGIPPVPPQNPTQMNMGGIAGLAQGGYPRRTGQISGPGTETSDSIPAMLSDGEFVMTAKAVRGAGKGDRRAGAKRMYALMHQLEKNAARG